MTNQNIPRPYLKWAGGKRRMLQYILPKLPNQINTYCEPFFGGGALFFELSKQKRFKKAILGDNNPELINSILVIRDNVHDLLRCLQSGDFIYEKSCFLKVRALDTSNLTDLERAARFIYLNKTCFNGLYRVNKSGKFNVPFGKYSDPIICDKANLIAVSESLQGINIRLNQFNWVLEEHLRKDDVVYFDPPYLPMKESLNFVGYTTEGFKESDHEFLASTFDILAKHGVTVILSNSTSPLTKILFSGYQIEEFTNGSNIGGPAAYRKLVGEVLIRANTI